MRKINFSPLFLIVDGAVATYVNESWTWCEEIGELSDLSLSPVIYDLRARTRVVGKNIRLIIELRNTIRAWVERTAGGFFGGTRCERFLLE